MVKPTGPLCNLDCKYCFYTEKTGLFPKNERWKMPEDLLERFTRDYIEAQPTDHVTFAWQGGEPTMCGIPFFEKALEFQRKYASGKRIENAFQTNGTLLDDDWGAFLAANNFLVGISIDGPKKIHDANRLCRKGQGTFDEVVRGVEVLKRNKVEFNTLTCVSAANATKGAEVYRFLRGLGSTFMQFIPIVERRGDEAASELGLRLSTPPILDRLEPTRKTTAWSVSPRDYGDFLVTIFDRWVRHDVGRIFVQLFDITLAKWAGAPGGMCVFEPECGAGLALEHDGGLYACDHFVYPEFERGNVGHNRLAAMVDSMEQRAFGRAKQESLPRQCRECPVRTFCNGGCPKHRFLVTRDGEPGLNYLCQGYARIFTHMAPYMRTMADLLRRGQPPARIMEMLANKPKR